MNRNNQAGKPAEGSAQKKVDWKALEIVHPDAAGIDVGGSEHWVAISPDRDPEPVRRFGCFTVDLREKARWLIDKGYAVGPCNPQVFIGCLYSKCWNSVVWKSSL